MRPNWVCREKMFNFVERESSNLSNGNRQKWQGQCSWQKMNAFQTSCASCGIRQMRKRGREQEENKQKWEVELDESKMVRCRLRFIWLVKLWSFSSVYVWYFLLRGPPPPERIALFLSFFPWEAQRVFSRKCWMTRFCWMVCGVPQRKRLVCWIFSSTSEQSNDGTTGCSWQETLGNRTLGYQTWPEVKFRADCSLVCMWKYFIHVASNCTPSRTY